MSKDVEISYY